MRRHAKSDMEVLLGQLRPTSCLPVSCPVIHPGINVQPSWYAQHCASSKMATVQALAKALTIAAAVKQIPITKLDSQGLRCEYSRKQAESGQYID